MSERSDGLLTYEEAAQEIGFTLGSLKQVISRGGLHPIKVPRERRKFLRYEEVIQYRDAKPSQPALARMTSTTGASNSNEPVKESHTLPLSRQEITDTLQLMITEANKAWTANAEAYQASAAAIRDGFLGALQAFSIALIGSTDSLSPMPREFSQPRENTPSVHRDESNTPTNLAGDFYQRMQEALAQREAMNRTET